MTKEEIVRCFPGSIFKIMQFKFFDLQQKIQHLQKSVKGQQQQRSGDGQNTAARQK
jgi:hypothetical protein